MRASLISLTRLMATGVRRGCHPLPVTLPPSPPSIPG